MNEIIEVTPDKDGRIFIKLYGTRYEIKIKEAKKQQEKEKNSHGK